LGSSAIPGDIFGSSSFLAADAHGETAEHLCYLSPGGKVRDTGGRAASVINRRTFEVRTSEARQEG
jgi:hypothetical protein